jgi:hypothetical protein
VSARRVLPTDVLVTAVRSRVPAAAVGGISRTVRSPPGRRVKWAPKLSRQLGGPDSYSWVAKCHLLCCPMAWAAIAHGGNAWLARPAAIRMPVVPNRYHGSQNLRRAGAASPSGATLLSAHGIKVLAANLDIAGLTPAVVMPVGRDYHLTHRHAANTVCANRHLRNSHDRAACTIGESVHRNH